MSKFFSAAQYDDAYLPRRRAIWAPLQDLATSSCTRRRCWTTKFVGDDRGYLLPGVRRKASSPFGDMETNVWEMTDKFKYAAKFDRIKHPEFYDRPPCSIFVARRSCDFHRQARETAGEMAKVLFKGHRKPQIHVVNNLEQLKCMCGCEGEEVLADVQEASQRTC